MKSKALGALVVLATGWASVPAGVLAAGQSEVVIELEVPPSVGAWERVEARVTLENRSGRAILPTALDLSAGAGRIAGWGVQGPEVRWADVHRAVKTERGWELLWDPFGVSQQVVGPPDGLDRIATDRLLHLQPLPPGATVVLSAGFEASYSQGEQLTAKLDYLVLDPKTQAICRPADKPDRRALVACKCLDALPADLADLYLPLDAVARDTREVKASGRFEITHPVFDVDQARARAKVPAGPFGYDRHKKRWILVDERGRKTLLVGRSGPIARLPGNWLGPLVGANGYDGFSLGWFVRSADEGEKVLARLRALSIRVDWMVFKGHRDDRRLTLEFKRAQVAALAKLVSELGAEMISRSGASYIGW